MDKLKRVLFVIIVLAALGLTACTRTLGAEPTPEGTDALDFLLNSPTPTNDYTRNTNTPTPDATEEAADDAGGGEDAQPTATEAPASTEAQATATLHIITPTPQPDETEEPQETPDDGGEQGQPTMTFTPVVIRPPDLNPDAVFKGPHYVDSFDDPQPWYDMSGMLPDSQYIKIDILEGDMHVTGKLGEWDTWWLSGYTLYDYYIEMDVESRDCAENDAYGIMVRASQHGEPTRGYIVGLTCDGKVFAKRLTSANPYVAISILNPTESDLVNKGPNQTNTMGVWAEDNVLEIYINRYYYTVIYDDAFSWGRYGIFVKAGGESDYTYTANEIRVWGVVSDD
jgi:hypothetical protein